jgi:hypothetical protein
MCPSEVMSTLEVLTAEEVLQGPPAIEEGSLIQRDRFKEGSLMVNTWLTQPS